MVFENGNLSGIIRDFKSRTSKALVAMIKKEPESRRSWLLHMFTFYANRTNENEFFKVWSGDNHPEEIFTEKFLFSKLVYIHENPVRAGWVAEEEHYILFQCS